MRTSAEFHTLLSPQALGEDRFQGSSLSFDPQTIFGGQLMAQVLGVAAATLDEPRHVHYLQCDFVAAGDPSQALDFSVSRIRDGGRTSHRQVALEQNGVTLLMASVSFQQTADGFSHQLPMPTVPEPEQLLNDKDARVDLGGEDSDFPFLVLHCPVAGNDREPLSVVWAKPTYKVPEVALLHQQLFTFFSDTTILMSALKPHSLDWDEQDLRVATMNHSIWFHRPVDVNDWKLMYSTSPSTGGGRALSTANVFSYDGELIATVAQEGLLLRRTR